MNIETPDQIVSSTPSLNLNTPTLQRQNADVLPPVNNGVVPVADDPNKLTPTKAREISNFIIASKTYFKWFYDNGSTVYKWNQHTEFEKKDIEAITDLIKLVDSFYVEDKVASNESRTVSVIDIVDNMVDRTKDL